MRACSLRLTNVYGPRQLIRHNRQGFIGWFVRLALDGGEIQVFGDGSQVRDFVHVDDVCDAFLRAGASDAVNGEVFNVGGAEHWTHADLVALLVSLAERRVVPLRRLARRRRRPSTSAASTPTPPSSRRPRAGRRPYRCATAWRARWPITAQHYAAYVEGGPA